MMMKRILTTLTCILMSYAFASSQNVGIGTTTPGALLDVSGDALINGHKVGCGGGNAADNTVFGFGCLQINTSGTRNVAMGYGSMYSNTIGHHNVAYGSFSLLNSTTGNYNTVIGDDAMGQNLTGESNTSLGYFAGYNNSTGNSNTFIGFNANPAAAALENSSAIGNNAYVASSNSMVLGSINGINGAAANTNVGIGTTTPAARLDVAADILINGITVGRGGGNVADNTAIGNSCLSSNTSGNRNVGIGLGALNTNTTGNYNVANGTYSLWNNTTGSYNSSFGDDAMYFNTTGSVNTVIGQNALHLNIDGQSNVAVGSWAGNQNVSGSDNTFIGTNSNSSAEGLLNASAIGNRAFVAANNCMVLGSINGVNGASANTKVGIGTTTPTATLEVAGTLKAYAWKTASMSGNGYAEMGGVLLQWGTANYNSNVALTITFPKVFVNVYSVTATVDAATNSGSGANVPVKVLAIGNNTFQIAGTVTFSGDNVSKIRWMAVGI